jgi:hypothetical protein
MAEKVKITGTATLPGWRTYDVDLSVQLSLRDLFAAFALAAVVGLNLEEATHESDAAYAYKAADAMLKARDWEQPQ